MFKKAARRLLSVSVAAALTAGMIVSASAYKYPSAYWKLHDAWGPAVTAQDSKQVLSLAQQTYDLLTKDGLCQDVCFNLEPKCARAAWCAEMTGDIQGAIKWLTRQRELAKWLDANVRSYRDTLLDVDAHLEYLNAASQVEVYALQDGGGTLYGSPAEGSKSGESAVLMYVTFQDGDSVEHWIDYCMDTSSKFRTAATQGGVIELAWNFASQSTAGAEQILSSSADSYIAESLQAMGDLNATVLLRVGAEMNNWPSLDSGKFIAAFQKIAKAAKKYDNIKMVFSPDNVSNRNVTFEQFYPGDQYVDWIGVSTYHTSNYAGNATSYTFGATGYGGDAYYGKGLYDSDPLVILRPLVRFAQQHGKPMMISECGFSYTGSGGDQTAYAVDQLNKFYSYVNMIYPQIKAVFYFDHTVDGSPYSYRLRDNASLSAAYDKAIAANGAYLAQGERSGKSWSELNGGTYSGKVKLASYATFPGQAQTSVTYYLDGKAVSTVTQAPFYYELDTTRMAPGKHTVKVQAKSGGFTSASRSYEIYVQGDGSLPLYSASGWAQALLEQAEEKELITKRNRTDFQAQITRLQFAELAVNLIERTTGKAITPSEAIFTDTSDEMVLKAVAAGVTSGVGEGTFAPNNKITRQEMCVMLNKVIQYVDKTRGTTTLGNPSTQMDARFTDTGSIASWAVESVALMTNNGVMSGKDGGRVAPKDNAKIEEAVVLILGLYNKF